MCVVCASRFSEAAVRDGTFFLETLVCLNCYQRMYRQPRSVSCFGKDTLRQKGGGHQYGFDPHALECKSVCPDRNICQTFVRKGVQSS